MSHRNPPTYGMKKLVRDLRDERDLSNLSGAQRATLTDEFIDNEMSYNMACNCIDKMKQLPYASSKTRGGAPQVKEDGLYELEDGALVKVQVAVHGSGRLYAKRWNGYEFEVARGLVRKLRPEQKLSRERMKELSHNQKSPLYGRCGRCYRTLTDETSIAEGIGRICAGREEGK